MVMEGEAVELVCRVTVGAAVQHGQHAMPVYADRLERNGESNTVDERFQVYREMVR